jgi:predicted DNA-binding transcriptional regulator AlpA
MASNKSTDGIVRPQDLADVVGFSHHTARRTADFPAPVQLSVRAIGWRRSELLAWLDNRPRGYLPTDSTPRRMPTGAAVAETIAPPRKAASKRMNARAPATT